MTEAEFLRDSSQEFEMRFGVWDTLLARADEASWQVSRPDNGWTTAQIVEHLCLTTDFYGSRLEEALRQAPPSDGTPATRQGFLARMILIGLRKRRTPAPSQLVVNEAVSSSTALERWNALKAKTGEQLALASGKSLSAPRFPNPFMPMFKMSAFDFFSLQMEHLRYHQAQIEARVASGD